MSAKYPAQYIPCLQFFNNQIKKILTEMSVCVMFYVKPKINLFILIRFFITFKYMSPST